MGKSFTYRDFETGEIKRTRGKFSHITEPQGPLNVRYVVFRNPKSAVFVPLYCLTQETAQRIGKIVRADKGETNEKDLATKRARGVLDQLLRGNYAPRHWLDVATDGEVLAKMTACGYRWRAGMWRLDDWDDVIEEFEYHEGRKLTAIEKYGWRE